MKYIFMGAQQEHLESGRPLVFGDQVTRLQPEDQRLVDLGLLVQIVKKETDADAAGTKRND